MQYPSLDQLLWPEEHSHVVLLFILYFEVENGDSKGKSSLK